MQTRLMETSFGNQHDGRGVGRVLGKVHVREAQLVGQRLGDLLFGGEVHPYEHRAQAIARSLVLGQGDLQICLADQPRLDETFANLLTQSRPLRLPTEL